MKKALALGLALMSGIAMNAQAQSIDFSKLSPQDKEEIGKAASEYMVANPTILMQISQALQAKQQQEQQDKLQQSSIIAISKKETILNDAETPFVGPKDAKIAFVEFFDYNCVYCSKVAPDLKEIIENNKDVKFIFKEMPIFANSFPTSKLGAQLGAKVFKEKGSDGYIKYHNAIYDTKHFEGELTVEDVENAAKSVGVDPKVSANDYQVNIDKNMQLAMDLSLNGTPAFIFMPTSGQTPDNTLVTMGAVGKEQLQGIIDQLREEVKKNETKAPEAPTVKHPVKK